MPAKSSFLSTEKSFSKDQKFFNWSRPVQVKSRREGGSSTSLCESSVISHFQEVLSYCVTKTFQSEGQIFSLLLSFQFECRADFNVAESTSSDHKPFLHIHYFVLTSAVIVLNLSRYLSLSSPHLSSTT